MLVNAVECELLKEAESVYKSIGDVAESKQAVVPKSFEKTFLKKCTFSTNYLSTLGKNKTIRT